MTANKVIEIVDEIRPNAYDGKIKFRWINELDCLVQKLVFQNETVTPHVYPDDMDKELLIPAPFDELYALYVEAMIDYHNREYENYNNSIMMFDTRFTNYKKAYIREHPAKG